jgi:cyclophilin family peptidyl-prolyl cis-trans isomerase/protein-disulfide isomerase
MERNSALLKFGFIVLVLAFSGCSEQTPGAQPTATYTLAPTEIQRTVAECTAQSQPAPEIVTETDHIGGLEQGHSVTIVVYNDFACSTCQTIERALTDSLLYFPDDVRLIYRHFADLENPLSVLAAKAAEAAGLQDHFWDMHAALFDRQEEWLSLEEEEFLVWLEQVVTGFGLDVELFWMDLESPTVAAFVVDQSTQALLLGQTSAPIALINGNPIPIYVDSIASFYYWLENLMIPSGRLVNKQFTHCPEIVLDPELNYLVTLHTEKGDIQLALYPEKAPFAVNNFVFLAENNFYDENTFFQVIEGQLALTGDPSGTGWGNPGYFFSLEVGPEDKFDRPGLVAMWNSGPTSNGSQFFITYSPLPEFTGRYTIFGEVISGMEVLNSLTPRNAQLDPLAPLGDLIMDVNIETR